MNDDNAGRGTEIHLPKSVSSSPLKNVPEVDGKPFNGAAAHAVSDLELDERNFGELTDLRPSVPYTGGMKHAESIMSFHIDLGPSMLGDILSVMDKKGLDDDDLGFEEGKSSSPPQSPPNEVEEEDPFLRSGLHGKGQAPTLTLQSSKPGTINTWTAVPSQVQGPPCWMKNPTIRFMREIWTTSSTAHLECKTTETSPTWMMTMTTRLGCKMSCKLP